MTQAPRQQSPALRQANSPMMAALVPPPAAGPAAKDGRRSPGRLEGLMPPTRSPERHHEPAGSGRRASDNGGRDVDGTSVVTSRSVMSRAQSTTMTRGNEGGVPAALMGERESIHRTLFSQLQQLPPPHSQGMLMGAWLLLVGRNSFLADLPDDSDDELPGAVKAAGSSGRMNASTVKFAVDVTLPNEDPASPKVKANPLKTPAEVVEALPPAPNDALGSEDAAAVEESTDDHNTAIFIPLPVILVILAIFLYCCVVVFWFPDSRPYSQGVTNAWSGGHLASVEAAVPFVAVGFYTVALAYANALNITFLRVEKQHVMDKRFVRQLRGKAITFCSKEAVQLLERANASGLTVSKKVVEQIRQHGQREQVPADVYARYISSLASIKARRVLRRSVLAEVLIIATPLLIAVAPWFPRLAAGGSIWAQSEVEEIAISILGPVLTFLALNSVGTMLQTHAQTLSYHRERVARVACALPDPAGAHVLHGWPMVPFDTILNVTLWNRVRWALSFPPNALHRWGMRVFDLGYLIVMGFFAIVALTSIFRPPAVRFDGTMALMLSLLIGYCPVAGHMLYVALEATLLEDGNRDVLCRILVKNTRAVITDNLPAEQRQLQISKSEFLRAAMRDVATSVADQLHPVRFLGHAVTAGTFLFAMLSFLVCVLIAVLRASFAPQMLPSL